VSGARANRLLWFGVTGGAIAWLLQFLANLALTFAQCNSPAGRWQLPLHDWEVGLSLVAIAIVLAAEVVCVRLFLQTYQHDHVSAPERHGEGSPAPTGRPSCGMKKPWRAGGRRGAGVGSP